MVPIFLFMGFIVDDSSFKTYGQESPGWISLFELFTSFFFENIQKRNFFLVKLIGQ